MANRIYIKMYNLINGQEDYILDSPLQEDVAWDIQTTYQDVSDLFPSGFDDILTLFRKGAQISGNTSKPIEDIVNQPLWQKTEPLKISTNLMFYTKTDPIGDVMLPTLSLCALNVLTDLKKETAPVVVGTKPEYTTDYKIPGISFRDAKILRGKNTASSVVEQDSKNYKALFSRDSSSTVCSVLIPGIIFLPIALCIAGKPTFSKEVTKSILSPDVFPLWAKVDVEIRSITPASLSMLKSQFSFMDRVSGQSEFFL